MDEDDIFEEQNDNSKVGQSVPFGNDKMNKDVSQFGNNKINRDMSQFDTIYSSGGVLLDKTRFDETYIKTSFRQFILTYSPTLTEASENGPQSTDLDIDLDAAMFDDAHRRRNINPSDTSFYRNELQRIIEGGDQIDECGNTGVGNIITVNLQHVLHFDSDLYQIIVRCPADSIVYMDEVLAEIVAEEYPGIGADASLRVCLYGHNNVCCMRSLNPNDIETLVAFKGIIIRASQVIPDMQNALFRCTARIQRNQMVYTCGHEESRELTNGEVVEPIQCVACQSKFAFELCHVRCHFGNKQLLKIQEAPESIPEGETPFTVMAYCYDKLVDRAKPGDRVEITGIYRISPIRVASKARTLKSVFRMYIDVNYISKESTARLQMGEDELDGRGFRMLTHSEFAAEDRDNDNLNESNLYPPEVIEKLKRIASDPNVYENLVKSLAPNIWENEDVKKGLLCQLFSGVSKKLSGGGGRVTRADIHVLLCGDPSTAKSQLLQCVNQITPRGVYTCGKGTSAVGLTASVSRDPETREFVLESGAIVLSDRGICCIDEFDKMDDSARVILHEVMEQQTVSIAKAGIVCSLNARASILASANPIYSKYDTKRSVIENINLPPALISRFDLTYLILDTANEEVDRNLATHLCSLYSSVNHENLYRPPIDRQTFTQFVSYAKRTCRPKFTAPVSRELVDTYITFRRSSADSSGKSLSATPRQMETLIRLSEARAKMRLADTMTVDDVKEAARLIQVATYNAIVDPVTGRIDFDQLNRGISGAVRERREVVEKFVLEALKSETNRDNLQLKVQGLMAGAGYSERDCDTYLRELENCVRNLESIGIIGKGRGGRIIVSMAV